MNRINHQHDQKFMSENYFTKSNCALAARRHDGIARARGTGVTLADVKNELLHRDGLRLSEIETAGLLLQEPLDAASRRGLTGKSAVADAATRRAANASKLAEDSADDSLAHQDAADLHRDAASHHAACRNYHLEQARYHSEKARGETAASIEDGDAAASAEESAAVETAAAAPSVELELCCARSLPSFLGDGALPDYIHYMPEGTHTISPSQGGNPVTVTVLVNEESAERLERQRQVLEAGGNRVFLSVQHNTQIAAFWVNRFSWDTRLDATGKLVTGVWADGTWTAAGKEAVTGKNFRSFSPTFFVNAVRNDPELPVEVVTNPRAKLNMGALENDPAFEKISPLWKDTQPTATA